MRAFVGVSVMPYAKFKQELGSFLVDLSQIDCHHELSVNRVLFDASQ